MSKDYVIKYKDNNGKEVTRLGTIDEVQDFNNSGNLLYSEKASDDAIKRAVVEDVGVNVPTVDSYKKTEDITPTEMMQPLYSETDEDKAIREAEEKAFNLTQVEEPDKEKTREQYLNDFQDEIDALNEVFTRKKAEITSSLNAKSKRQLGSQRALLANSGMLGQVSGASEKANLENYQTNELNSAIGAIDSELASNLAALRKEARTLADADYEAKRLAYAEGASSLVDFLRNKKTRATENISNIVKSALLRGNDLTSDSYKDEINRTAQILGVPTYSILDVFREAKKAQDEAKAKAKAEAEKEAIEQAKKEAETAKILAETYKLNNPDDQLITVDGGLYNATKDIWIKTPNVPTDEYTVVDGQIFNKTKGVWAETGTVEAPTGQNSEKIESIKGKISLLDDLLDDKAISSAVGPNFFARLGTGALTGANSNFVAGVENLISQETMNTLLNLKQQGGTLGALSDSERTMLKNAASKIGYWGIEKDGKVVGYNANENDFKAELNRLKTLAEAALERAGGTSNGATEDAITNGLNDLDFKF